MGELVVRLVGGVHALFGVGLLVAGIGLLADDAPGTVLGWIAVVLGGGLVAWMIVTGLRLGLGEPVPALERGGDGAGTLARRPYRRVLDAVAGRGRRPLGNEHPLGGEERVVGGGRVAVGTAVVDLRPSDLPYRAIGLA